MTPKWMDGFPINDPDLEWLAVLSTNPVLTPIPILWPVLDMPTSLVGGSVLSRPRYMEAAEDFTAALEVSGAALHVMRG